MDEWEKFTAWTTKYALSRGIRKIRAQATSQPSMIRDLDNLWGSYFSGEGCEWHRTEAAAIERAEAMRVAKIAALEKQIAKLRKLRFAPQELNGISEVPK